MNYSIPYQWWYAFKYTNICQPFNICNLTGTRLKTNKALSVSEQIVLKESIESRNAGMGLLLDFCDVQSKNVKELFLVCYFPHYSKTFVNTFYF